MSSILTSTKLIQSIRRRGFIPRDQATFTDVDFLEMATDEVNLGLMEQLITARGDYLVVHEDFTFVEGVKEYPIPSRAHGNKLRSIEILDSSGHVIFDEMTQIELDLPREYRTANCFYVRNNCIVFHEEAVKADNKIRMYYYLRPNKLVTEDRGAKIISIVDNGDSTTSISFSTIPKHFTSDFKYDFVAAASPNKIISWDIVPVSLNFNTKTLVVNNSDLKGVVVGDFVTIAEETIVPNVPTEYHPVIAQRVAVACLEAMGDEQNKQSAERKLAQMEKAVLGIVTNRVEGQPKKIRQRNGSINNAMRVRVRHRMY